MIRIGITWCDNLLTQSHYTQWISAGDPEIEVITLNYEQSQPEEVLRCDGLLISGGVDIEPERHGQKRGYAGQPDRFDPQRDEFEFRLFELSRKHAMPLLGVCRGMQLINCALGGSLHLDNGDEANLLHCSENYRSFHCVDVAPSTLLQQICNTPQILVNSQHHQSIARLGSDLVANCHFQGVIEGIEWRAPAGKPFLLGVQWHPEAMSKYGAGSLPGAKAIRQSFLTAVQDQAAGAS
ncbi:MAG: hypothetical protein RL095_1266 [Verrucomicrobiota bacterium]|jgi:putative glutamine amidotransferase